MATAAADDQIPNNSVNKVSALRLFVAFLRLGAIAFGGLAMVARIRELSITKKRRLSETSFADRAAPCQPIRGAAMQAAAYTGLRAEGPLGALTVFTDFGLPAFCLKWLSSPGDSTSSGGCWPGQWFRFWFCR